MTREGEGEDGDDDRGKKILLDGGLNYWPGVIVVMAQN